MKKKGREFLISDERTKSLQRNLSLQVKILPNRTDKVEKKKKKKTLKALF